MEVVSGHERIRLCLVRGKFEDVPVVFNDHVVELATVDRILDRSGQCFGIGAETFQYILARVSPIQSIDEF